VLPHGASVVKKRSTCNMHGCYNFSAKQASAMLCDVMMSDCGSTSMLLLSNKHLKLL
jgi:hypothetical protein